MTTTRSISLLLVITLCLLFSSTGWRLIHPNNPQPSQFDRCSRNKRLVSHVPLCRQPSSTNRYAFASNQFAALDISKSWSVRIISGIATIWRTIFSLLRSRKQQPAQASSVPFSKQIPLLDTFLRPAQNNCTQPNSTTTSSSVEASAPNPALPPIVSDISRDFEPTIMSERALSSTVGASTPVALVVPAPPESKLPETLPGSDQEAEDVSEFSQTALDPPPTKRPLYSARPMESAERGGSFVHRLFSRPAASKRPTDLRKALQKDRWTLYREAVAVALFRFLPTGSNTLATVAREFPALLVRSQREQFVDSSQVAAELSRLAASGPAPDSALEVFAEVTNALIVALVDDTLAALPAAEQLENATATALAVGRAEELVAVIDQVGVLFSHFPGGESVAPIQYNGAGPRERLLALFEAFLTRVGAVDQRVSMASWSGESAESAELAEQLDFLNDRLNKLQFLLDVKADQRRALEHRMLRDPFALLLGEQSQGKPGPLGSLGSLSGLTAGLKGLGGGLLGAAASKLNPFARNKAAETSSSPFDKLLRGAGGGAIPSMEELQKSFESLFPDGFQLPDPASLRPDQMQEIVSDFAEQLRESVAQNKVTAGEIEEMERICGSSVEEYADKLGDDKDSTRQIFRALAAQKQKLKQ